MHGLTFGLVYIRHSENVTLVLHFLDWCHHRIMVFHRAYIILLFNWR